uniref:Uncharacterized protein n=1 Tax=Tanacetum cinerariifolium TaxID=118510 RepID=A0A6L2KPY1_TANCI|nr:hypothetical protein [Tanacetum cinerariifolium]
MNELTESADALKKYVQNFQVDFSNDILDIPNKLNEFTKVLSALTTKIEKLEDFKPELANKLLHLPGDLEDKGVASIATSSSYSGTISKHLFSSAVSSSATLACSYSASLCFLALFCSRSYPVLLELPSVTSA